MSARKWFSRPTTKKATPPPRPPASPDRRRRLWAVLAGAVLAGAVLAGAVLVGWSFRPVAPPTPPSSSPPPPGAPAQPVPNGDRPPGERALARPSGDRPSGEPARQGPVPNGDRPPEPVVRVTPTPSVPAPVATPPQRDTGTDPFRAYRQIVGAVPPRAVPTPRPLPAQTLPPPPVAPLPALPAPSTVPAPAPSAPKPRPLTLQQRLQASGWSVEAVAAGAEPNVLLSHRGERGLYRVGETLEERIRIERIESNRVILARDGERAALEVLP